MFLSFLGVRVHGIGNEMPSIPCRQLMSARIDQEAQF